jgi:hypothetical protein
MDLAPSCPLSFSVCNTRIYIGDNYQRQTAREALSTKAVDVLRRKEEEEERKSK